MATFEITDPKIQWALLEITTSFQKSACKPLSRDVNGGARMPRRVFLFFLFFLRYPDSVGQVACNLTQ